MRFLSEKIILFKINNNSSTIFSQAGTSLGVKYAHNEAYLLQAEQLQLVTVFVVAGIVI